MTCKEQEFKLRVAGGLDFYEVSSIFIKKLEAHQTYEACFWAFVLLQSGYYKHVWKRLAIYANQSSHNQIIVVSALRNSFDLNTTAKDRQTEDGFCFICRAIIGLPVIAYIGHVGQNADKILEEKLRKRIGFSK